MTRYFIGLISGTSMDGVDAALVDLDNGDAPRLVAALTHPMPATVRADVLDLCAPGENEIDRMGELDNRVAAVFAQAVEALLARAGVDAGAVEAIGSHGQTIRHRPYSSHPFSLQIGNPAVISEITDITTVGDFRRADMAAGGQGAPLVPALHQAVFRTTAVNRVVLNIGGMANITVLPAESKAPILGFDTGPGNVLLDAWAMRHLNEPVDRDGQWGAAGQVDRHLLALLLDEPYFRAPPPKSTGREQFHLPWLEGVMARANRAVAPQDVQATLCELTAISIAEAIDTHAPDEGDLLVCGGGVHNADLMKRLREHLPNYRVASTGAHGLDPDFVEAVTFAWLAKQALEGKPGNVTSVTGARHATVLGAIYKRMNRGAGRP